MALQAQNKNMKSNVTELNGHMETKGQMHTQKAFIDKMIKKQRADRERLYSKLGGSELGGQAYGEEERFVFTELNDDICFECCNEGFARQLMAAKYTKGLVYFRGSYLCTPTVQGAAPESFSYRTGKDKVYDFISNFQKPK